MIPQFQDRERLLKIIIPFSDAAGSKGCISVIGSLPDVVRKVHDRTSRFIIPATVLLLIFLLHALFTRGITRRIDRIAEAMSQAEGGDLRRRAPVDRKDELGVIAERFNALMGEIERASLERDRLLEEQKGFNARLQGRVADATQELSAANDRLRQANEDLIETQRRLSQSERAALVGQMAATFAHEIGSPLSAISTHLQLMAEDPDINSGTRRRVQLTYEQVNRITGFVEELLSETRAALQPRSKVDLNALLHQLLLFLDQHLQKRHVSVRTEFSPELPEIGANPQQLQQVFLNLLNNACDAMPDGGEVRLTTAARVSPDGEHLAVVAISDNGVGIPADKQDRIFERFFTTKELGRGTGLGLSIAAKIVRQHNGSISLQSSPGAGTTFTIAFRVAGAEAAAGGLQP
jgi:two-component system, NtrC family, sensor kinase